MGEVDHEEVFAVRERLWRLSAGIERASAHWISGDDDGLDRCEACALAEIRRLIAEDPERRDDISLDGGWRREHDASPICDGCGARLDGSLTAYGAEGELAHFLENGVSGVDPEEARDIDEMLSEMEHSREPGLLRAAMSIARGYLALATYAAHVEPGNWADDGGQFHMKDFING